MLLKMLCSNTLQETDVREIGLLLSLMVMNDFPF